MAKPVNDKHKKNYEFFVNEGFLALDNKSYPLLQKYKHNSLLQEKTITAYIVWQFAVFGLYKIINDCLCCVFFHKDQDIYWTIHRPEENSSYPLEPIIDTLCSLSKKAGLQFLQIKFIDEYLLEEYKAVQNHTIQTNHNIDSSEFLYTRKNIIELNGPANYYKRKRVKKYLNMEDMSIRPMTSGNAGLCLEIEEHWCGRKNCADCSSYFGCEKDAIKVIVNIFDEDLHCGLFLYNKEKPVGYIICEQINKKMSFLFFGKSELDDGFVYLIYLMYRDYLKDAEYMNFNEDMGHPGLRKFKKLFSPYELWHKYIATYSL